MVLLRRRDRREPKTKRIVRQLSTEPSLTPRQAASRSRTTDTVGAGGTSAGSRGGNGGGGIPVDLCQTVPGDQGRECPDTAVSVYSIPVERNVANVTIRGSGSATVVGDNSEVAVEVGGVRDEVLASATSNGTLSFSKTYRNISRSISSEELTLSIETTGLAGARLDGVTIWKDTDGDGFTDQRERIGFETSFYGRISTDPLDPDTDGDGLDDEEEIGEFVSWEQPFGDGELDFYLLNSHPLELDTDGDGLNDSVEAGNWTVEVVNRNNTMYRWNSTEQLHPNESRDTVNFTSSPLLPDTDLDGLTDYEEKVRYHTDPESRITYEITREHQREIFDRMEAIDEYHIELCVDSDNCRDSFRRSVQAIEFVSSSPATPDSVDQLYDYRLTDRTDDFDYVLAEDYAQQRVSLHRFTFESLDGLDRTDTWLPNVEEGANLDPWDPDTDDDGLTDGQEAVGLTILPEYPGRSPVYDYVTAQELSTEPNRTDTDGDGWWDGWYGVYGVGRTDNVVLYRENLNTDDGVKGHETVPEQAETHNVTGTTPGADVDSDPHREHSNIHIGERRLGTSPLDPDEFPSPTYTAEIDVYSGNPNATDVYEDEWINAVERNFALYGIYVTLYRNEALTDDQLENEAQCEQAITYYDILESWGSPKVASLVSEIGTDSVCIDPAEGFNLGETAVIANNHADINTDDYIFIADEPGPVLPEDGVAINYFGVPVIGIYADPAADISFGQPIIQQSPYDSNAELAIAVTIMHEIGHSFNLGRADDATSSLHPSDILRNFERYSGMEGDDTQEFIRGDDTWSIMSGGSETQAMSPMDGKYFAFSLEELFTVDEP